MYLIPDVLDLTELREVRALIESSPFVDGKTTAGYRAKRVKDNEQLSRNCDEAEQAKQIVLTGLSA